MRSYLMFIIAALWAGSTVAAPAAGETYVYRVVNAYNNEVRGQLTYRVEKVDAGRVSMTVTPEPLSLGTPYSVVVTGDANWLRHPLINHDMPVEYDFSPAFPAYVAPLNTGNSWSTRVHATNPATGTRASVRVDGDVIGNERVSTPAGSFDTVRVKRRVYAGDWEAFRNETNIEETEWFAPGLGRPVKVDRKSGYIDQQKCATRLACSPTRGDWFIYELVSYGK
jgi:hypothetical protein